VDAGVDGIVGPAGSRAVFLQARVLVSHGAYNLSSSHWISHARFTEY
jgi:hypothetical protein